MNLTNIPAVLSDIGINEGIASSSFIGREHVDPTPFTPFLLDLHSEVLTTCPPYMSASASSICNLGTRFEQAYCFRFVGSTDLNHRVLVMGLKRQTEPEDVISGYLRATQTYGTAFHFYRLNRVDLRDRRKVPNPNRAQIEEVTQRILPARVDGFEANRLMHRGVPLGHLVLTTCFTKNHP